MNRVYVPGDVPVPPSESLGGKAGGLLALMNVSRSASHQWRVPAFVVLLPENGDPDDALLDELEAAVVRAGIRTDARLAVRSSAAVEDGASQSFAGQFESVLGVDANDRAAMRAAIVRVRASARSARVAVYTGANATSDEHGMAVVVQEMVDADVSGVAFSVDPVAPGSGLAVVSSVPGLGEGLVSGALDADTYWINVSNSRARTVNRRIVSKSHATRLTDAGTNEVTIDLGVRDQPSLTDDEAAEVGAVATEIASRAGTPQDIEWALERYEAGGRRLAILQSRPITTLGTPAPAGERRIWDNSNIAESYSGVTTPLTFTFARSVYEDAYRQFFTIMGVEPALIERHREVFANMLGLVRGRVYYNLLNWYRVLSLLPGFRFNRSFMERMMGVRESLAGTVDSVSTGSRFSDGLHLARTIFGMLREARRLPREVPEFHARVEHALAPLTPERVAAMSGEEAVALYRRLQEELLRHWRAPLVNDFFAMVFFGVLGRLTERWLPAAPPTLVNDLLVGDGDIISTQPARNVMELARLVRDTPEVRRHFDQDDDRQVWESIVADPASGAFRETVARHLARFGDRTMEELKLETITLGEDPSLLVGMIRAYLTTSATDAGAAFDHERRIRRQAEAVVNESLGGIRRAVIGYVLSRTRMRVRDRENLRFERTRVFGTVRRIFLSIGSELATRGHLSDARDVFYLTKEEIFAWYDGTSVTADLRNLVARRRADFAAFEREPSPPDRIETHGPLSEWRRGAVVESVVAGDSLQGIGCCPGVVRAKVRVVTDPRGARDLAGRILVAERTDPGWTLLFPIANGLLVQRGSLLSHSAIVAREMGLPCIVGLSGLMSWLQDGDEVEMDGTSGVVRRLTSAPAP